MAVKIRLKRLGKIRSPHYRIVVADSRTKRDGRAIEEIGKYHPKNDPSFIEVNSERAQYWLSVGAQPTEAVVALLKRTGDWQSFSGDTSPSGVQEQKVKPNKLDVFNAALAEAGNEPSTKAISKKTEKKAESTDAKAESTDDAKADSTDAKPESTDAKPESTEAKAESTEAKAESTDAKAESTEAKVESTEAKVESTDAKTESTEEA